MKTAGKGQSQLDRMAERIRKRLERKDAARESCLKSCREIIRISSRAIRAVHRQENDGAAIMVRDASIVVRKVIDDLGAEHADLLNANYVHDAFKEFAEASITYRIVFERTLPDPDALGVPYPAFLNGLAESVGELRRYLLDGLRHDEFSQAEYLLDIMDQIYSMLVTMDFPDAVTYGLRRNTDSVRGIVEKTRGELTLVKSNDSLRRKLDNFSKNNG
jgi:translin